MKNISKWNYMKTSSTNYGVNSMAVAIGNLTLWFSYNTVVAFSDPNIGNVVSENIWGTTTGKHLNAINPDKKVRVDREKFEVLLAKCLRHHNLSV